VCERRCICREESLLNTFPQKRQACWSRPILVELDAEEESAPPEKDCIAFWEFVTIDTDVGRDEVRKDRPLCPLTDVAFEDFS